MSMLASRATKTLPIPFTFNDPGDVRHHEVTIQKLSGRHLWKADTENDFAAQEYVRKMGGAEFRKQLEEATKGKPKKAVATAKADPVNLYDKHTIVFYGLRSWTYDELIPEPKDAEARKALVEDLDPDALEWLAREILRFTRPALFKTEEEAKADQKETHADSSAA
jgi:hypothetical protein